MSPSPSVEYPVERIVLTGFMGAGKTTVGRALAARLSWRFADLDDAVAEGQGRSVPQIFAESGEAAFRRFEAEALAALLQWRNVVIALGGGAPGSAAIAGLLRSAGRTAVIHLDAAFDVLYGRCRAQALDPRAAARPLLGQREETEARFQQRRPLYAAIAHHTVEAEETPEAVASTIATRLQLA